MQHYRVYGLDLASEIHLRGFSTHEQGPPDAVIRRADIPEIPDGNTRNQVWRAEPGYCFLNIPEAGRFLIRDGREILFDPAPSAGAEDIEAFLVSSAIAALLHQRGITPIHAGVVATDRGGIFFCGPGGVGKSTTTAALAARGLDVFSDDVMAVSASASGEFHIAPGPCAVRLWKDAADRLDIPTARQDPVRAKGNKFIVPFGTPGLAPIPIRAGFVLRATQGTDVRTTRLAASEAFEALWARTFRRAYAIRMGLREKIFRTTSALAAQTPMWQLERPIDRYEIGGVVDAVLSALGD